MAFPTCPTVELPPGIHAPAELRDFSPLLRAGRESQSSIDSACEARLTIDSEANKVSSEDESLRSAVGTSSICSETSETSFPSYSGDRVGERS